MPPDGRRDAGGYGALKHWGNHHRRGVGQKKAATGIACGRCKSSYGVGPLLALGASALHTEEIQSTPHRVLDAQGTATEMREYEVVGVQVAAVIPHVQSVCDIEQLLDPLTGVGRNCMFEH